MGHFIYLAFSICLAVAAPLRADLEADTAAVAQTALPDSFGTADGFDLKAHAGQVVLLNFWATWCGPCKVEIPDLVKLQEAFAQKPVALYGVSIDRGQPGQVQSLVRRFAQKYKINYPILLDSDQGLAQRLGGVMAVPTTFIIDRQGKIRRAYVGPRPFEVLARDIRALLEES